jgi:hypothetical protein
VFSVTWIGASHGEHRDGDAWSGGSKHVILRNEAMSAGCGLQQSHVHRVPRPVPPASLSPNEGVREGFAVFIRALPKIAAQRSGLPEG